jgi:thiamine-monophosphate kinase
VKLDAAARAHLADRYLLPRPRNALARAIREHASASIDVSDGLVGDLMKLAAVSGVGARIEAQRVPLSAAAKAVVAAEPKLLESALTGGDDYEIVAAVAEERVGSLKAAAAAVEIEVTAIGRIEAGTGVEVVGADGRPMTFKQPSFSHF